MKPIKEHIQEFGGGERKGSCFVERMKGRYKWVGKKLQRQLAEDNCVRRPTGCWKKKSVWSFVPSVILQWGA